LTRVDALLQQQEYQFDISPNGELAPYFDVFGEFEAHSPIGPLRVLPHYL
jgi:hypothetical protein